MLAHFITIPPMGYESCIKKKKKKMKKLKGHKTRLDF
jgi:hypothetical protein